MTSDERFAEQAEQGRASAGAAIAALRIACGLDQADAARLLGVSKSYLSHVEAGRRPATTSRHDLAADLIQYRDNSIETRRFTVVIFDVDEHAATGAERTVLVRAVSAPAALEAAAATPPSMWRWPGVVEIP